MIARLEKEYKWLFEKQTYMIVNGKKVYSKKRLEPIIEDHGSHYRIYKEKDSSPLILSKNYE